MILILFWILNPLWWTASLWKTTGICTVLTAPVQKKEHVKSHIWDILWEILATTVGLYKSPHRYWILHLSATDGSVYLPSHLFISSSHKIIIFCVTLLHFILSPSLNFLTFRANEMLVMNKYLMSVTLFSFVCILQTGRVPLWTHLWRCSSESPGSVQWESVVCLQQWVWITHTDNSCPTCRDTKMREKSFIVPHTKLYTSAKQTEKHATFPGAQSQSELCLIFREWIHWYYKLLFLWMSTHQNTVHSV